MVQQELQVQSNLPIIILVVIIISLCVLAYLEYKKIMTKLDLLSKKVDEISNKDNSNPNDTKENFRNIQNPPHIPQQRMMTQQQMMEQQHFLRQRQEQINQQQQEKEKEKEKEQEKLSEYSDDKSVNTEGGGEYSDGSSEDSDVRSDNTDERSEYSDESGKEDGKDVEDVEDGKDVEDVEGVEDVEDVEDIVDITEELKEKYLDSDEIKEDKEMEKDLNDKSVNELKEHCKSLDLPVSGNKTKLIERIKEIEK